MHGTPQIFRNFNVSFGTIPKFLSSSLKTARQQKCLRPFTAHQLQSLLQESPSGMGPPQYPSSCRQQSARSGQTIWSNKQTRNCKYGETQATVLLTCCLVLLNVFLDDAGRAKTFINTCSHHAHANHRALALEKSHAPKKCRPQ